MRPNLDHHWMPFTANRDFRAEPKLLCRAEGVYYYGEGDQPILDGCSGLFTCPAGHARPEIADAVRDQLMTLDYAPSFTRGHPQSFRAASAIAMASATLAESPFIFQLPAISGVRNFYLPGRGASLRRD